MRGNSGIGHTKKAVGYNAGHFEAVEVLKSHLRENPVQGVLDLGCSRGAKEHHLYFCRHKKEIPPRRMDLAIEGETIESTDYAPSSRTGFSLQFKKFCDPRALFDQNGSDLYGWRDRSSCAQSRASVVVMNNTSDATISVPKVNSTNSLSRSGFINSSGCMSFLLAATARSHLVRASCWPKGSQPSGLTEGCSLEPSLGSLIL